MNVEQHTGKHKSRQYKGRKITKVHRMLSIQSLLRLALSRNRASMHDNFLFRIIMICIDGCRRRWARRVVRAEVTKADVVVDGEGFVSQIVAHHLL